MHGDADRQAAHGTCPSTLRLAVSITVSAPVP
jgi:hypothetical protein